MPANHESLAVCSGTRTASPNTLSKVFLPPEVWSLVVEDIDDYCWAWFVLRRVSRHLRQITEDVFAIYVLHNCQIRFSGGYVRDLLADIWHTNEYGGGKTGGDIGYWSYETISPLQDQYATFCFRPFQFSPPDTKDKVILKLRDHETDYKADNADYFVRCDWTGIVNHTQTFYLRRQCCTCATRIESAEAVSRCSCLAKVFFDAEDFKRLTNESHFVFFNDKLMSIRVPSIAINERAQVISLDWRLLCQRFYFEELKLRRAEKPWLRYLSRDVVSGAVRVDALGEKEFPGIGSWATLENVDDSWLFWDQFLMKY